MSKEPKEFEISRLLKLTEQDKYATTVAAFEAIDMLDQIEVPKKYMNRKPAIKALVALSDSTIQWDYISDEVRQQLEEELRASRQGKSALDEVFTAPGSAAPASDDSEEDLDEEVETEPPEQFLDDSDDYDSDDDSEDSDDDEDDSDDDDDSDDSDDTDDSDDSDDTDDSDDSDDTDDSDDSDDADDSDDSDDADDSDDSDDTDDSDDSDDTDDDDWDDDSADEPVEDEDPADEGDSDEF